MGVLTELGTPSSALLPSKFYSSRQSGFSLIEVMVAMLILTGSIVTLTSSWSGNYFRLNKAQINHNVNELLQKKITEIEIQYLDKPIEEIKDSDAGTFKDFPNYRWTMESQDFEMPDLSAVLIGQDGGADELLLTIIRQMGEHISKSVKEVEVAVYVKFKKNEVKYGVTTYFVDFDKELDLGSLAGIAGALGGAGGGN